MSKIIATGAIRGAHAIVAKAEAKLREAIDAKGPNEPVEFPNTGYYLPVIYGLTGTKVQKLSDMEPILAHAKELLPALPKDRLWTPYLGATLDAGMATLFAEEIHEALRYVIGPPPVEGIWLGAATDVILRERGIEFVDGRAPGFAAVVGAAPDNETAVKLAREMQQKSLYVFMAGQTNGKSFAEQLAEEGAIHGCSDGVVAQQSLHLRDSGIGVLWFQSIRVHHPELLIPRWVVHEYDSSALFLLNPYNFDDPLPNGNHRE